MTMAHSRSPLLLLLLVMVFLQPSLVVVVATTTTPFAASEQEVETGHSRYHPGLDMVKGQEEEDPEEEGLDDLHPQTSGAAQFEHLQQACRASPTWKTTTTTSTSRSFSLSGSNDTTTTSTVSSRMESSSVPLDPRTCRQVLGAQPWMPLTQDDEWVSDHHKKDDAKDSQQQQQQQQDDDIVFGSLQWWKHNDMDAKMTQCLQRRLQDPNSMIQQHCSSDGPESLGPHATSIYSHATEGT